MIFYGYNLCSNPLSNRNGDYVQLFSLLKSLSEELSSR